MQAIVRVCEENIEKTTVKDAYWINFVVKDGSLKDHIGRVGRRIKIILSRMIHHSIYRGISIVLSKVLMLA